MEFQFWVAKYRAPPTFTEHVLILMCHVHVSPVHTSTVMVRSQVWCSHMFCFFSQSSDLLAVSTKSDNWHISISEDMIKWKQNTMGANAACYLTTCHDSTEDIWLYYTFGLLVKWIRTQLATIAPHGNIKSIRSK